MGNRLAVFFIICLFFPEIAFSQSLNGKITDVSGHPVPSASVYIQETKQGLICNSEGEFQIKLLPGNYHFEFRCVGFESVKKEITVRDVDLKISIKLTEKTILLAEVTVGTGGEDPAYAIMRKAIEKAPYYQSVIKALTYETYSKGSGKFTGQSKLIEFIAKKAGENLNMYKDKVFMQESTSEIKYTAPDLYEQKVQAFSSTFPDNNDPNEALEMKVSNFSLYSPMIGSVVSPLNPKAFTYYQFRYEECEIEDGQIINKIRIIPKVKDRRLMEGIIYIADEEWNIRYADFTVHFLMGQINRYRFNYHRVIENIFLVTTCEQDITFGLMGMRIQAGFLHSIRYTDIQIDDSLIALEANQQKAEKKKEKKSLEIKRNEDIKKTIDTLAVKRDSSYWVKVRTIPLSTDEIRSYVRKDTMQAYVDSVSNAHINPKFSYSSLIFGGKLGNDSTAFVRFSYSGLKEIFREYNYVDGLWLGQSLGFDFRKGKNSGLRINPAVHWASARKTIIWKTDIFYDYAPEKLGIAYFSAGKTSRDFSESHGVERFLNAAYSLLRGENYAKLYEKTFAGAINRIDIANGLNMLLELQYAKREYTDNHTTWNFFGIKDKYTPNLPDYSQDLNLAHSDLAEFAVQLQYTPEYYYEMEKGKKHYVRTKYPTIWAIYKQGFDGGIGDNYSKYAVLAAGIQQEIKSGIFDRFNYTLMAGKFFNKNPFNYIDYKHFDTNGNMLLSFNFTDQSYALLPFYVYSTNKEWLQAFVNYKTDYLLLKRLPFLQGKLFNEGLQAKFLHMPNKKYYSEWAYSVEMFAGIGLSGGLFVAFDAFKYNGFGIKLTTPLFGALIN
ncbi:MAG: DUF5686 and carboxypeptidase regulatory-like domain-containing protein [Dysgonamonadaceae bacterium]|jgi:hypothetical protein|nr:DUF5686 and carboxypeptidase regulatory-like domain-containing protein [Dysgonamonadaceae bacterium]